MNWQLAYIQVINKIMTHKTPPLSLLKTTPKLPRVELHGFFKAGAFKCHQVSEQIQQN